MLKTSLKAAETDLRKKDAMITQLTTEIKVGANQSTMGSFPVANYQNLANSSSFFYGQPFEVPGIGSLPGSRQQKHLQQQKSQQLIKQNVDFRKRIKELKCDVALKDTEV